MTTTYLAAIIEAETVKDSGKRVVSDGAFCVRIKFSTGYNQHYEELIWTNTPDFKNLCEFTDVDLLKPICPELKGKRLWIEVGDEGQVTNCMKCDNPIHKPECDLPIAVADKNGKLKTLTKDQLEKLDLGKKIIEETMKKPLSSLNQKNNPQNPAIESSNSDSWDDL